MHGHEDSVDTYEGQTEVPLAERFIHHAAEHFREPKIGAGKNPEHGCDGHHKMEVSHNEIRSMQIGVQRRLCEKKPAEPPGDEYGNKADAEERGRAEAQLGAIKRAKPEQHNK